MDVSGSKSKKPSGASSLSKSPPEPTAFFLDRSLGKNRIALELRQAGVTVHVHDDHFPPAAKDEEWLTHAGQKGWVVLTKDHRIRYRNLERTALMSAGVGAFVLTAGGLNGNEMARIFVTALPAIAKLLTKHRRPFIAKITRSGAVSVVVE